MHYTLVKYAAFNFYVYFFVVNCMDFPFKMLFEATK